MNETVMKFLKALVPAAYKPVTMFPYPFQGEPCKVEVAVADNGLPYAEHEGMKVFFPRDCDLKDVETFFRGYLEDEGLTGLGRRTKSPHCYVTDWHLPEKGDVIVDIGCSEGFFSRTYASIAKRIYLFEADAKWGEPLRATFGDCWEKVTLIQKFAGDATNETTIRLEDALRGASGDVYFMKLDIEGAERDVLGAAQAFLTSNKVKMSCCAYHRQDDGRYLTKFLRDLGFSTQYSEGWMLPYGSRTFPFFRRGVIYARNF